MLPFANPLSHCTVSICRFCLVHAVVCKAFVTLCLLAIEKQFDVKYLVCVCSQDCAICGIFILA